MSKYNNELQSVYLPIIGGASALIFSTNITNPSLFRRCFSPYEMTITNGLWFNAHIGAGLYIYSRRHLKGASESKKVLFSAFGAVMFNFGTVLFWATAKNLLPESDALRTLFGLTSGAALLYIGKEYLQYIDDHSTEV